MYFYPLLTSAALVLLASGLSGASVKRTGCWWVEPTGGQCQRCRTHLTTQHKMHYMCVKCEGA